MICSPKRPVWRNGRTIQSSDSAALWQGAAPVPVVHKTLHRMLFDMVFIDFVHEYRHVGFPPIGIAGSANAGWFYAFRVQRIDKLFRSSGGVCSPTSKRSDISLILSMSIWMNCSALLPVCTTKCRVTPVLPRCDQLLFPCMIDQGLQIFAAFDIGSLGPFDQIMGDAVAGPIDYAAQAIPLISGFGQSDRIIGIERLQC